jgi:hypothetical protein
MGRYARGAARPFVAGVGITEAAAAWDMMPESSMELDVTSGIGIYSVLLCPA